MTLAKLFRLEPAPIDGTRVRRIVLLGVEQPDRFRLTEEQRKASKRKKWARERIKYRERRAGYVRAWRARQKDKRTLTQAELDRVRGGVY